MKKIVALLLMSVMMLALTGCGGSDKKDEKAAGSDKKVVLKLSHVFSPDEQLYKSMELVAERINKKTNGRVEIQCFGQNQLACYKDGLKRLLPAALSGRYLSALLPYLNIAVTLALISLLKECPKLCRRLSA